MFVLLSRIGLATADSNHRPNGVNNLQSRPAIKTINSCNDNPLSKQVCLFYLHTVISSQNLNTVLRRIQLNSKPVLDYMHTTSVILILVWSSSDQL